MAARGNRDRAKEQFWRRTLRQWRRSNLSIRAFCAEHGLAVPSFYAWRRIVAQRNQQANDTPVFVPVRVIDAPAAAAAAPAPAPALEVVLERGRVVRILHGCDTDMLRQLVAILEEVRPC